MPLREPPNAQVTSTKESLRNSPADMPDRGGPKPNAQVTSTTVPLGRKESPVAAFGAHPNQGTSQVTSTTVPLARKASNPYSPISKTTPEVGFNKK